MSQEGRWDEFLKAFFDRMDRPNEAPTVAVSGPLPGSVVGLEFAMEGTANDTDGNVTFVEWKLDRGAWSSSEANKDWAVNVSTAGLEPGLHRVSVRSRDDAGDYSREVQFAINVLSTGLRLELGPDRIRTFPGGGGDTTLQVSAFGESGGDVSLEVFSAPTGIDVTLPFDQVDLAPLASANGTLSVGVDGYTSKTSHRVVIRAYLTSAPLVQAFAVLTVDVTDRWADLVVTHLSLSSDDPSEGEEITIDFSVMNTGLAPALSFDVELTYRFDPGVNASTSLIRKVHVERLEVGERLDYSDTWRATIGSHEFVVEADGLWNNTDLDRTDNSKSKLLVLHGYAVMFGVFPRDVNVTPGEIVLFSLFIHNAGNLWDTLVLSHVNSTLDWEHRFNSTVFPLDPRATHEADLWVDVPEDVTGGTKEWLTLRLASTGDLRKYEDITVSLSYPETFGMGVTQDRDEGTIGPLATDSFNVTIENTGNGDEQYDLEYIRQQDHLLISAVVDTVEVAPGCSTVVEVFYSTLDTEVGGQSFIFDLRVRSRDDPLTIASVSFNVTVAKVFSISAEILSPTEGLQVETGIPLLVPLIVTNHGNYPVGLEVDLIEGTGLFEAPLPMLGTVWPGTSEEFSVVMAPKTGILMGLHNVTLRVREGLNIHRGTEVQAEVAVLRVDESSLRIEDADATVLRPGVNWRARLMLENEGNHPETFTLNTSFVPKWLLVELSDEEVTLGPYESATVEVTVWLLREGFDAPDMVMLVVNANPANQTDGSPQVVLDIALDVPPAEPAPWGLVVFLLAAVVVVLVVLVYIRQERLRS